MKPLLFILVRSLKNIIKGLKKKPAALIGYILIVLFVLFFLVITFIIPSGSIGRGTPELFRTIMTGIILIVFYFTLKQGIDKGSSYFRFSDVNIVFSAPVAPNKVLIYGFLKHLGAAVLILVFIIFQIPNLKNNFPINNYGVGIIVLTSLLYLIMYPLLGILLYSYTSKSDSNRRFAGRILNIGVILVVGFFFVHLYQKKDLYAAATGYLDHPAFSYIPIIGWFKTIISASVDGISGIFYLHLILIILTILVMVIGIYKLKADYYEDVLAATEWTEQRIKAKKEGRGNPSFYTGKVKKNVRTKLNGKGASAIFQKHLLEYRKTGFFVFFDKASIFIIVFSLSFKFTLPQSDVILILFFSAYTLFFFSVQGRWPQELGRHYIYLIPASPASKLFFATMGENIKNALDGIVLFGIAGYIFKTDLLSIILFILAYIVFGTIYIYGDIAARRVFGSIHSKALKLFMKFFLMIFVITPGIIFMFVLGAVTNSQTIMLLGLTVWNLAAAAILFFISKNIFVNLEIE